MAYDHGMNISLRTLGTGVIGLIILAALIFGPAGTLVYWQGWVFLIVFSVGTNLIGLYLALTNPALLARRLKVGPGAERRPVQKILVSLVFAAFFALPVVSVLDHRLGWSDVPAWCSVLGNLLVVLGLIITLFVLRANSYAAA